MSHCVYLATVPVSALPTDESASRVDLDGPLSAQIGTGTVLGMSTTVLVDGSLVMAILVDH